MTVEYKPIGTLPVFKDLRDALERLKNDFVIPLRDECKSIIKEAKEKQAKK